MWYNQTNPSCVVPIMNIQKEFSMIELRMSEKNVFRLSEKDMSDGTERICLLFFKEEIFVKFRLQPSPGRGPRMRSR